MGEFHWEPYVAVLKDGPRPLREIAEAIHGHSDDAVERQRHRHAVAQVMLRMIEHGAAERAAYGVYALPGMGEPARGPRRLYETLRENREGMTYADMMEATGESYFTLRKWVARLYKLDLIRSVVIKDISPVAHPRKYFAKRGLKQNREALFGEAPARRGYEVVGDLPDGSPLAFNAALRRLETSTLKKYGLDDWTATLVLRRPDSSAVAITKDDPKWVEAILR
jgi:hypothetical protein